MDKPIIEVDYGLASAYDEGIEVNRKLRGELRDKILAHERRHGVGRYNKKDFINDFQAQNSNLQSYLKFALANPEALIGFFPLMYSYHFKSLTFNSSAMVPFLFFGLIFSIFWKVAINGGFFISFLWFTILIIGINLGLLIITHILYKRNINHQNQ